MKALITGGAGFIGSHLADALVARGDYVTIIDDLSTGSIRNIQHLKANERFSYEIGNATDKPLVAELVDDSDVVFHLAAAVGVQLIVDSPVRTIETNLKATETVLDMAAKKRRKVLFASTSEVYGKSKAIPFNEDGDLVIGSTVRGRWAYACSKAADEFLTFAFWKEHGLPTVIGRLFNTVGPRQTGRYGMVLPRFVSQALADEPITVFGDGTQSRCFTYIDDAVAALIALMDNDRTVGEVFNIGTTEEITIMDLAQRVRDRAESSSEIVTIPYGEAYEEGFEDMPRRVPNTEKIRAITNWEPEYDLDHAIDAVIQYQLDRDNNP